MAYFAEINDSNIVLRVLSVPDEQEDRGQEFLADDLGLGGTWIQTSYNTRRNQHRLGGTPFRYNYAGVGYIWDSDNEAFYGPQAHASWSLDADFVWQPPTPRPDDGLPYYWDEDTTSWIEAEAS
jgi:hypothetical protein